MSLRPSSTVAGLLARLTLGLLSGLLPVFVLAEEKSPPRTDAFGDPLPAGAIARLGTVRFRHADYVRDIAFTPDGKTIISAGDDGVRVWERATGKPLRHFGAGASLFSIFSLSADGRRIALRRYPLLAAGPVEVWDVESGKLHHKLGNHPYGSICLSPDGKQVAAVHNNHDEFDDAKSPCRIGIWDAATGQRLKMLNGPKESIASMRFSVDGKMLFLGGARKTISIFDVASGKEIRCLCDLPGNVCQLILSPGGDRVAFIEWLVSGDPRNGGFAKPGTRVFLVDTRTGVELRRWTVKEEDFWVEKLAFSPDGKRLAACTRDGPVLIWDVATGKETRYLAEGRKHAEGLAFSPDGQTLAAVDGSRTIRLLDCTSGSDRLAINSPRDPVNALAVAGDGRVVFTATVAGTIYRWDARTGRKLNRLIGHKAYITALALSADARKLYSVSNDRTARVWRQSTGEQRRLLEEQSPYWARLALSFDGALLAISHGDHNKEVLLIEAVGGKRLRKLTTKGFTLALALPADATIVRALIEDDKDLLVQSWETMTERPLPDLRLPPDPETTSSATDSKVCVVLSPDGKRVAHSEADKVLRVLDVDARRVVYRLTKLPDRVSAITFAPDGRTFAWAESSGIIHWLETATWKERRTLPGHTGTVEALAISRDGRILVSGSADTTTLVWDLLGSGSATLPGEQCEACWTALAEKDAAKAYRTMCQLIAAPSDALAVLRSHLKPVPVVEEARIAKLIANLDANEFAVREKATEELRKLGELAEPAMRKALASRPTLEMKRRLQDLLAEIEDGRWHLTPDRLRQLRAIEVLERIGTPEAQALLKALADGAAGAPLTQEARAAVQRLQAQRGDKP
jgi:WD40 repeat protein